MKLIVTIVTPGVELSYEEADIGPTESPGGNSVSQRYLFQKNNLFQINNSRLLWHLASSYELRGGWYRSNCEFRWQRCCCCYHVVTPLLDKTRMLCNNDNILVWNAGPGGREKQDRSSSNKIFREDIAWFVFLLKKENSVQFCEWQQDLALQAFQSVFKRC